MPQAYSFCPSPKRRFIRYVAFSLVFALGSTLLKSYSIGYLLMIFVLFLLISLAMAHDDGLTIKIEDGVISGPPPFGFRQTEFTLADIDKRRTKSQSLWNKLNGQTIVYAKNGQKIQINHNAFNKAKREEILGALKLNEYP